MRMNVTAIPATGRNELVHHAVSAIALSELPLLIGASLHLRGVPKYFVTLILVGVYLIMVPVQITQVSIVTKWM